MGFADDDTYPTYVAWLYDMTKRRSMNGGVSVNLGHELGTLQVQMNMDKLEGRITEEQQRTVIAIPLEQDKKGRLPMLLLLQLYDLKVGSSVAHAVV